MALYNSVRATHEQKSVSSTIRPLVIVINVELAAKYMGEDTQEMLILLAYNKRMVCVFYNTNISLRFTCSQF